VVSENAGPATAGLAVGAAFVILFSVLSNVGACGAPGLQISPPDLERQVETASLIVYGTVMSAELQQVDWKRGTTSAELRYVVTIVADKYLFDETGEQRPFITFVEPGFGCAYPFRSEVYVDNYYAVEHKTGERALFFIDRTEGYYLETLEGDWNSFALFDKFAFAGEDSKGNKLLQSKWYRIQEIEPVTEQKIEAEIKTILSK
jgi:hypothetical protein